MLASNAPSLPKENFTSLTRLDYNRLLNHVCQSFGCKSKDVRNIIIWGNHSKNHFCDIKFLEIEGVSEQEIQDRIKDFDSRAIEKKLHERGGFIADKMNAGAYLSAAKSIIDHLKDWFMGHNKRTSMGVMLPKDMYGLPQGICFSVPTLCLGDANFQIIDDLSLDESQQARLLESRDELLKEKAMI